MRVRQRSDIPDTASSWLVLYLKSKEEMSAPNLRRPSGIRGPSFCGLECDQFVSFGALLIAKRAFNLKTHFHRTHRIDAIPVIEVDLDDRRSEILFSRGLYARRIEDSGGHPDLFPACDPRVRHEFLFAVPR